MTGPGRGAGACSRAGICRHYRTRKMFRRDGSEELDFSEAALGFSFCWCTLTGSDIGQDEGLVNRNRCSQAGRECFTPRTEV